MGDYYMPTTNNELKHSIRIQLKDWKEVRRYLEEKDYQRLELKTEEMIEMLEQSLQD